MSVLAGIRVLVVDDDADARLTLTTMLEQFGAVTTGVMSADEAVANADGGSMPMYSSAISPRLIKKHRP